MVLTWTDNVTYLEISASRLCALMISITWDILFDYVRCLVDDQDALMFSGISVLRRHLLCTDFKHPIGSAVMTSSSPQCFF